MPKTIRVAITSHNPVKIEAVQSGFAAVYPDKTFEFLPISVATKTSHQPLTDLATLRGAEQRAAAALNAEPKADFGVGLEGGLMKVKDQWFVAGWVVIENRAGVIGRASSGRAPMLPAVMKLVLEEDLELGEADDRIFKRKNSKQDNGYIGIITDNLIRRGDGFREAVIVALTRFKKADLFKR